MDSISQALLKIPLLAKLEREELEQLAQVIEYRQIKKGQRILKADEPGHFIMFLVSGRVNVVVGEDKGKEAIIDILEPGELFGELSLLTGMPRSASVDAAENGSILVLSQMEFEKHVLNNNGLTRLLLQDLAGRLRDTTTKAADLLLLDVYRRLARTLLSLGTPQDSSSGNMAIIEKRPTHKDLAALIGTTREMVTKALQELEAAGHIKIDGKKIIVISLPN